MYTFSSIDNKNKDMVIDFITRNWGAPFMVTKGKAHNMADIPGFVVKDGENIIGLITYSTNNKECEIVSLDSLEENKGIGSRLIELVIQKAKEDNCHRLWLITTNDNTKALRFYQRRGFDMTAFYHNAVEGSRKIKPEIPEYGNDNIPILHEIELEYRL